MPIGMPEINPSVHSANEKERLLSALERIADALEVLALYEDVKLKRL